MYSTPPVTRNLIITNVVLFLAYMMLQRSGVDLNDILGLHFWKAQNFQIYQLLTYMFMHANWQHIFFNMFSLWMFGRTMESTWGSQRFLFFYLLCGIGAGVFQEIAQTIQFYSLGLDQSQLIDLGTATISVDYYLSQWTTVGASGACYGILLGFGLTYPNNVIMLLFPPIPLKAKYFVFIFAIIELLSSFNSHGDNVAHLAHLGGMVVGWIILRWWRRKDSRTFGNTSWEYFSPDNETGKTSLLQKIRNLFKHDNTWISKEEPYQKTSYSDRSSDETYNTDKKTSQNEIDRILDKIKQSGYSSLTNEEKRKLFEAANKK